MAETRQTDAETAIRARITQYAESVIHAEDPALAERVWALTPESSFIHPRGHERGWAEVRDNFYGKTMAGAFSKRDLKLVGEPTIRLYGDSAVVEFEWNFTAAMKDDGSLLYTRGRESQVYVNTPEAGWKLVHVHYSGPLVTGRGEGF